VSKSHSHSHSHSKQKLSALKSRLRGQSRKITGPRAAILEILRKHPHPLTNRNILSEMQKGGAHCNLATVYRSMHMLEKMGMVKRFDFGDGSGRFELMGENDDGHHHHLVCTRCSAVVEIEECFTGELEEKIAERNGFTAISHKLEFFGICPQCR